MKESLKAQNKNIIFRETFQDEASVRANGGTVVGVTFLNGRASSTQGSTSYISYPNKLELINNLITKGGSIRFLIYGRPSGTASSYRRYFRFNLANGWNIQLSNSNTDYSAVNFSVFNGSSYYGYSSSTGSIVASQLNDIVMTYNGSTGVTLYVNGVAHTTAVGALGGDTSNVFSLLSYATTGSNDVSITGELFEIYNTVLTANEVKNLYENKQNEELQNSKTQTATTELIVNANDRTFESGTTGNWVGTYKSTSFTASTEQAHSGTYSAKYVSDGSGAGEIRLSNSSNNFVSANTEGGYLTAWIYSSHAGVYLGAKGIGATSYFSSVSTTINGWQQLSVFVPDGVVATNSYVIFFNVPSGATVYFDDISWKKTLNNTTKEILRVDARNGVISNKYSGSHLADLLNLNFQSGYSLVGGATVTSSSSIIFAAVSSGVYNASITIAASKTYRVYYKMTMPSGNTLRFGNGGVTAYYNTITMTGSVQEGMFEFSSGANTGFSLTIPNSQPGGLLSVDYMRIHEVIPAVANTATTVVRDGNVWAMNFNGSTSKIDCGTYDTFVGNKTLISWLRPRSSGENDYGGIVDKDSFSCNLASTGTVRFTRNSYSTSSFSASGGIKFGTWNLLVITSTSTGITNFFINGALNGTANQSGGTPAGNTSQITIGNRSNGDRTFNGELSNTRVIDGILSTQEIAQIYQSEKAYYNL